ncbi:MAG: glycine cleavage system aminomethyltransferase GcvT [Rhodospirillaceae bacterium]|nr:glycine cleavage system aminomethyltransferase GcvT [Rhodospirillaceae bacterium]
MATDTGPEAARRTPLYDLHVAQGGRMVDFAGYALPVQYRGIIAEHEQARDRAALFDVSHMGQARIVGARAAEALESLVPGDIAGLGIGRMRYTQLTDDNGGIRDDLMVSRLAEDELAIVVNAACKDDDFAYLGAALAGWDCALEIDESAALLALQGPKAAPVLEAEIPGADGLAFLQGDLFHWRGAPFWISRSGYTGEDGFEISVPASHATALAEALLDSDEVALAGLGARDSLRLEAGLCLYGHDIDLTTTPVEAGLSWSIGKRRRAEGGFVGAGTILDQLRNGPARRRIGLRLEGRAPAREGAEICDAGGAPVGRVTSGGFGPTVGAPVAMGYVAAGHAAPGTPLTLTVRGRALPARAACLPFIAPGYRR